MDAHRRGFLRQLTTLPLIGGGITLLGQPTAVAEPASPDLLEAYKTWLHYESRFLRWEMAADPVFIERFERLPEAKTRAELSKTIGRYIQHVGQSGSFHGGPKSTSPYTRAALVMSAVGCDWKED